MPLIILGLIFCISLLIYTLIKNKKEINEAEDRFAEGLYSAFEKFRKMMNQSSTTFTTEEDPDDNDKEKEEDKILFIPHRKDKNTED